MTPKHSQHLSQLLDAVAEYLRRYVVITSAQVYAIALWVAHTHVLDAFETTPFLAVTSPTKRCGKSRLLDVLELVVARAWRTITPTEAVLYRKIEKAAPTLMLDETDAIFSSRNGDTEPLRALLNAGNRRGTSVPRCVGPLQELKDFAVFCAKVLAGIGTLPDTIMDRSIVVRMARKRPDENTERFRQRDARELAEPIRQELESWAAEAVSALELARPEIPHALNDRAEEAWEPLLAIAELAGGAWPERARLAALELSGADVDDEEELRTLLLRDIHLIFRAREADRVSSSDLVAELNALEESPWGDLYGKEMSKPALARRLRAFAIRPRTIRLDDDKTPKGYLLDQFEDAWCRYLDGFNRHTATSQAQSQEPADSDPPHADLERGGKPASTNGCGGVADKSPSDQQRALIGDEMYPVLLADAVKNAHLTQAEAEQQYALHQLIEQQRGWPL